jgi:hypothetical protein
MADVYRLGKSKLLYGIAVFTSVLAFFLVLIIRQDVRFGISVFGECFRRSFRLSSSYSFNG